MIDEAELERVWKVRLSTVASDVTTATDRSVVFSKSCLKKKEVSKEYLPYMCKG